MLIDAFNDIELQPFEEPKGIAGYNDLSRVAILGVGTGNRAIKADPESGFWIGANRWADAPFRVAMDGTVTLGSGYTKLTIFKQDGIPTSVAVGDLWFDSNDSNKVYRAGSVGADQITAGEWELVRDSGIAQALSDAAQGIADAATAQGTADSKVVTFIQATAPTAEAVGDLWIDSDDKQLYRWSGAAWLSIQDTGIAQAISDAADAQATADGKIVTFYQTTAPTATAVGDLWTDTDDGNKLYRWSGAAWVAVDDTRKVKIFAQAAIPTSIAIGDVWFDTDDSNKPYRAAAVGATTIAAGQWEIVDDQRAADALLKSVASQTLTGDFSLNDANVKIDGANKRILINDGTNNRILIGYQASGF